MSARSVWVRRIGIAAVVAVAMGYVPYHLYASSGLARLMRLRGEAESLHAGNIKLAEENRRLRQELDSLVDGPGDIELSKGAIERVARDELGLVRPGEIVFKIEATH
jgi:cell division protein FtsB